MTTRAEQIYRQAELRTTLANAGWKRRHVDGHEFWYAPASPGMPVNPNLHTFEQAIRASHNCRAHPFFTSVANTLSRARKAAAAKISEKPENLPPA